MNSLGIPVGTTRHYLEIYNIDAVAHVVQRNIVYSLFETVQDDAKDAAQAFENSK